MLPVLFNRAPYQTRLDSTSDTLFMVMIHTITNFSNIKSQLY